MKRLSTERTSSVVAFALILGWMFWFGVMPKLRSLGSDGAVISFDVSFDSADAGSTIADRLAGPLEVPEILETAAACRNGTDWMSDVTLDNRIVVSTRSELVRGAELAESDVVAVALVHAVESNLWRGVTKESLVPLLERKGFDRADIDQYLVARQEPPSADAQARFVAYAAARNLFGSGVLRVVDARDLDEGAIRSFANQSASPEVIVAGSPSESRRLSSRTCRSVLETFRRP